VRNFGSAYRGLRSVLVAQHALNRLLITREDLSRMVNSTQETAMIAAANMHHDAITGTSTQWVIHNYYNRQNHNILSTSEFWTSVFSKFLESPADVENLVLVSPYNDSTRIGPGTYLVMNQAHGSTRILRLFSERKRLLATDISRCIRSRSRPFS